MVFEDIDPADVKGQVLKALDDPADGNVSTERRWDVSWGGCWPLAGVGRLLGGIWWV